MQKTFKFPTDVYHLSYDGGLLKYSSNNLYNLTEDLLFLFYTEKKPFILDFINSNSFLKNNSTQISSDEFLKRIGVTLEDLIELVNANDRNRTYVTLNGWTDEKISAQFKSEICNIFKNLFEKQSPAKVHVR